MKATITFAKLGVVLVAASFVATAEEEKRTEVPPQPQIEIIQLGYVCGGRPGVEGKWWGLYPSKSGFELVEVVVTSEETEENPLTGDTTVLRANREGEPLFLIRGMKNARPGPVNTDFEGHLRLAAGEEDNINNCHILYALGNAVFKDGSTGIEEYSINIRSGRDEKTATQEILHEHWASPSLESFPTVRWIGDLDRDRKPDILLDARPYPGAHWILFLSSEAEDGEIIHRVEELNDDSG